MEIGGKTILVCDCGGTMPLDGRALARACAAAGGATGDLQPATQLCRREIQRYDQALRADQPLIVACTQEAPLFTETLIEARGNAEAGAPVSFVNIRERAGWSDQAADATAKMAALIAEAALDVQMTPAVSMKSDGVVLVYGRDEAAIEAAKQLSSRLDATVLLTRPGDVAPPAVMELPVFKGTIAAAKGHLGAFEVVVDDYAPAVPSGRGHLRFEAPRNGASSTCDLILDLTGGPPLFSAHEKRDGYVRPDPGNPAQVQKALYDIADMIGEFEKPRYIAYNADICTHSRNRKTGCTRCLDVCPTGAIAPSGDHVAIDPYVCAGCGACASVCPTGAAGYALPAGDAVHQRLRTLLGAYRRAGGIDPVLFVHDQRRGEELIAAIARYGRGLPARVLPFALNEVTQIGFDFFASALAYGAGQIRILVPPSKRDELAGLAQQIGLIETAMSGLGYGAGRVAIIDATDPAADPGAIEAALYGLASMTAPAASEHLPMGGKRTLVMLGLRHLHAHAPAPVDVLPLPAGAPFGNVAVDIAGCTLCLACVGVCPTGALLDSPDKPALSFVEDACVQCGLCRTTCPEKVIRLEPRLNLAEAARSPVLIKEEEPFHCVKCGKPFGTKSSIEKIVAKLADKHWMFKGGASVELIKMCETCRVAAQFESGRNPYAGPPRPAVRTTDDDLRERDIEEARARLLAERKGPGGGGGASGGTA
jgi:ferredoxin